MPPLSPRSAQAPFEGIASPPLSQVPDAYYSNDDIEILYSVVSRAQEILSNLPEGEQLATNALFSAYDEVLPLYGIDPEEDHHLSRLVFRIGGERGVGSLLDSCRDVLLRMGIELEIDSDSATMSSAASSHVRADQLDVRDTGPTDIAAWNSPDDPTDTQYKNIARSIRSRGSNISVIPDHGSDPALVSQRLETDPTRLNHGYVVPELRVRSLELPGEQMAIQHGSHNESTSADKSISSPKTTNPAIDLGRDAVQEVRRLPVRMRSPTPPRPSAHITFDWSKASNTRQHLSGISDKNYATQHPIPHEEESHNRAAYWQANKPPVPRSHHLQANLDDIRPDDSYHRLKRRASRAWVLLQLTRAISHWAVFSDEKLERAAIARRHILRIRYFSPWVVDAAESKKTRHQKAVHKHVAAWSSLSSHTVTAAQNRRGEYERRLLQRVMNKWTTRTATINAHLPRPQSILSRMTSRMLQQWQGHCHQRRGLLDLANRAQHLNTFTRLQTLYDWEGAHRETAVRFQRCLYIFEALRLWTLVVRGRQLQDELQFRSINALLRRWRDLRQDEGMATRHGLAQSQSPSASRGFLLAPEDAASRFHQRVFMSDVLKTWRRAAVTDGAALYHASIHATQQCAHRTLMRWFTIGDRDTELGQWAHRARVYLGYTKMLQTWKQAVPRWSSSVQRAYVRCRWRHKALIARNKLSQWRASVRYIDVVVCATKSEERHANCSCIRKTLASWQHQCHLQQAMESPAYMHDIWLNEWTVSLEGQRLVEHEASNTWALGLKSKVWNKWRSVSVQLHSQLYIVTDVTEKNTRKSVRRILTRWKSQGETLHAPEPMSLAASSYGLSRGSRVQDSVLWSKARSGQTAASSFLGSRVWPGDVEEDFSEQPTSELDEMGDVISTPTRRIEFEGSLARLPTTTPLAPLSTPFERELRGRYVANARMSQLNQSAHLSIRGTPRLSAIEARRIAEQRRRRRPG
ncbi:uncharacterized protein VDAG_04072 [Verticillium dahliae VdLs.17]|uniref:Sfi1 spindle body domain-containing protein n=1 Tax=Verticillium dahliae (strain VdLs.17 / ATCC MYA-4575 / FGSC 10137) TaxID=498257 RepID=G2X1E3_VERDV|nr:uncharacterized protein VDAG_04072 [Verticillium dahliae VdLs.17]EGY22634.1 hypothetical protein VDAG_04072 [Verticillium dahliae VdLs.17]KAH6705066.1 hypothetical protein EV126DRAFT_458647 [Verticillium dahliae]